MQELHVNVQDQTEEFYFETTENTAFDLRVYLYETINGVVTPKTLTADNSCKYYYYVNAESSEVVQVVGTVVAGLAYVDFEWTVPKTSINGRFASSINIYSAVGDPEVWANGQTYLQRNPSTGSNTPLDTTTIINWSEITNIGALPWMIGNSIINIECADSPYQMLVSQAAKTIVHSEECDMVIILPKATAENIGKGYGIMNLQKDYTVTLQCLDGDYIDDSPEGGTKTTVRGYSIPSSLVIRQVTATEYVTIFGDGAWDTGDAVIDFSSSSDNS